MKKSRFFSLSMIALLVVQLGIIFWFGFQKQGYHYDEYYSYYSSNVTYSLNPTDMEWKDTAEIRSEFMALEGESPAYGTVRLMQSWDVHPPLYYYVLRTVCWLSQGVFSKWQGLSINIFFFVLSWLTLAAITKEVTNCDKKKMLAVCALFGFSPAIMSGIMFIRMYMMLTFVCMFILYIHIRSIMKQKRTVKEFYLPIFMLSFIGFHIHYYFAVFLFFLAAAVSLYMFFHKENRKESFIYAGCVVAGLILSVLVYPASLGHIFRGYRGTEAQDAFFDFGNIGERLSFFFDLTNEYVFGNMLVFLLLGLILLGITKRARVRMNTVVKESLFQHVDKSTIKALALIAFVTVGYFCVVAKTALLNAEEAIRYEMPVYGLLILLLVYGLGYFLSDFGEGTKKKWTSLIFAMLMVATLLGELAGLANGKVCFLYPQDRENVDWAAQHSEEAVVFIYNPQNKWMIWDESEELMQYEQIYFASSENEEFLPDERLSAEDTVYAYVMRGDAGQRTLQELEAVNGGFSKKEIVRELLYCDLYKLNR